MDMHCRGLEEMVSTKRVLDRFFESSPIPEEIKSSARIHQQTNNIIQGSPVLQFGEVMRVPMAFGINEDASCLTARLYGGDIATRSRLIQKMLAEQRASERIEITLDHTLAKKLHQGALRVLLKQFGHQNLQVARLETDSPKLCIKQEKAVALLKLLEEYPAEAVDQAQYDCTVCLNTSSEPILTKCRHIYCRKCFCDLCSLSYSHVECAADCSEPILLAEMKQFLDEEDLEAILAKRFKQHIDAKTGDFVRCPTLHCDFIHSAKWSKQDLDSDWFLCHSCFEEICLTCKSGAHTGQTYEKHMSSVSDPLFTA